MIFYTAILNNYDKDRSDIKVFKGLESDLFKDPVMNARRYKILSHQFIKGDSCWLDGNIYCKNNDAIIDLLDDYDLVVFLHPVRKDIFQEHSKALRHIPIKMQGLMAEQVASYRKEGFDGGILVESGVLIRKDNEVIRKFNTLWWAELCRWQWRDQISFPYIAWKMKDEIKIKYLEGPDVRNHPLFTYIQH